MDCVLLDRMLHFSNIVYLCDAPMGEVSRRLSVFDEDRSTRDSNVKGNITTKSA